MTKGPTSYFRFEDIRCGTGYTDEWGEYVSTGSYAKLQLREFKVVKRTPTGVRLDDYSENGRLVLGHWHKQWASPTVEEARQSFIARKKRQLKILKARVAGAEEALALAESPQCPDAVGWIAPPPPWAQVST